MWQKFKRYHYLTSKAPKAAKWYCLDNNEGIPIGILGVIHFPCKNKKLKKCSRLVILPDYQGIGLGTKFLNEIAKIYLKQGFDFAITTTAKNLINSLVRNENWCLTRYGKTKPNTAHVSTLPRNTKTYTFFASSELIENTKY